MEHEVNEVYLLPLIEYQNQPHMVVFGFAVVVDH